MIKRYSDPRVTASCSLEAKFEMWQTVELVVIEAREKLGRIPSGTRDKIEDILDQHPIDLQFIEEREKELNHDLNAFLEERMRWLPTNLQQYFHADMTSYDTEESPFIKMLSELCDYVIADLTVLFEKIKMLAIKYRFTPMNARTHGQEAEMQSFGKRCLTWHQDLKVAQCTLDRTLVNLEFSKLSGAIGTNSGIDPELEKTALEILGFKPWMGATQIMTRAFYSPIAHALADIETVCSKIAQDTRLSSRSGRPLCHEPFSKMQKGSSAMPHKKNNIIGENTAGMACMARHYAAGLQEIIVTWEERDISQSSVERVFWPDLFHVTLRAIKNLTNIMNGLAVYPDNMMIEIIQSRGTYASNKAKEVLAKLGLKYGLSRDEAYRIVQLASFNVFEPSECQKMIRDEPASTLREADVMLENTRDTGGCYYINLPSIRTVIADGKLRLCPELDANKSTITKWNKKLQKIFSPKNQEAKEKWDQIFRPSYILANEAFLFKEVFGV